MGCIDSARDAHAAMEFRMASARLAREAALLMRRPDEEAPSTVESIHAIERALQAMHDVERRAKDGVGVRDAYGAAAGSLHALAATLGRAPRRRPGARRIVLVDAPVVREHVACSST